ncbi:MAG: DNA-processing protein DprA [Candidatus Fimimonas sp.]
MNYTTEEKICILFGEKGVPATKFYALWQQFEGVNDFLQNFESSTFAQNLLSDAHADLSTCLKNAQADKIIAKMESLGIVAVTCFSDDFPQTLANVPDPPYILFCMGNVKLLNSQCIAVVGTRKASVYGKRVATDFTQVLAQHFTVVSGLAYGVDSIAHETTLKNNGKTIAVLGGGLVNVYPASNRGLAEKIVQSGGLVLTEYGVNAQPKPYHFPHRNRIVSGLSLGVLVCQSPLKSGTASTVECALEQGRDVFAVPGEIFDSGFSGNNALIKSMQGVCVTSPQDLLDFYNVTQESQTQKVAYQLSFEEQTVVNVLSDGQLSFDKLVEKTKISAADLNFLLANLEIKSIIARLPGNSYRLYGGLE